MTFNKVSTLFNQNHVYNTKGSTNQMLVVVVAARYKQYSFICACRYAHVRYVKSFFTNIQKQ